MNTSVNLLPGGFRRRQSTRRIVSHWAMLTALVISTMMLAWIHQSDQKAAAEIAELQAQAGPIDALVVRTSSIRQNVTELESRWRILQDLLPTDDVLQTIGSIAIACEASQNRVQIDSLELNIARESRLSTPSESTEPTRSPPSPDLVLRLRADDDTVAAGLVDHLKMHPRFQSVNLHSAGGSREGSKRTVELQCEIVSSGGTR